MCMQYINDVTQFSIFDTPPPLSRLRLLYYLHKILDILSPENRNVFKINPQVENSLEFQFWFSSLGNYRQIFFIVFPLASVFCYICCCHCYCCSLQQQSICVHGLMHFDMILLQCCFSLQKTSLHSILCSYFLLHYNFYERFINTKNKLSDNTIIKYFE